nr:phosphatidylcholine-sterol acyltransferase-like [Halyomorpha halys]
MAKYSHLLLGVVIHWTRIHFVCSLGCHCNEVLAPVILVPGVGGNHIKAQLDKPTVKYPYCARYSSGYTLWLDLKQLLPIHINCWVDNMKLNYDHLSKKTFNQDGVKTWIPGFGDPKMVEYLIEESNKLRNYGQYLNKLVNALIIIGYIRQENLFAAPYDFRKGPSDDLDIVFVKAETMKKVFSSMPSLAYLLPVKQLWNNEALLITPEKNYSIENLEEFFYDIGNPTGWEMYLNEKKFAEALPPPGVEVYCFYGEGVETLKRIIFQSNDFDGTPVMVHGSGDGTVNLRSLQYCNNWIEQQEQMVVTRSFHGIGHMEIVESKWE